MIARREYLSLGRSKRDQGVARIEATRVDVVAKARKVTPRERAALIPWLAVDPGVTAARAMRHGHVQEPGTRCDRACVGRVQTGIVERPARAPVVALRKPDRAGRDQYVAGSPDLMDVRRDIYRGLPRLAVTLHDAADVDVHVNRGTCSGDRPRVGRASPRSEPLVSTFNSLKGSDCLELVFTQPHQVSLRRADQRSAVEREDAREIPFPGDRDLGPTFRLRPQLARVDDRPVGLGRLRVDASTFERDWSARARFEQATRGADDDAVHHTIRAWRMLK